MLLRIKNILSKNKLFFIFLIFLCFTRFYKIEEFITFLGDQGRDAIIIKRIITLEHFPAIGPPSSVGQVFLGPFFYYLMSPFLLIFNFNPIGLAFGTALLSIISLSIIFFILKKISKSLAFFFLFLSTFSSIIIYSSRFSWNPNLLPYFAIFNLYFLSCYLKKEQKKPLFLTGVLYALLIQLHYLSLLLIIPIGLTLSLKLMTTKKSKKKILADVLSFFSGFFLFNLPLILFDIKNNFLNSRNFLNALFQVKESESDSYLNRFLDTNINFFNYVFNKQIDRSLIVYLISFLFFGYFFLPKKFKENSFIKLNWLTFFTYIFAFSYIKSFRFWHYYQLIYLSFFILIATFLTVLYKKNFFLKIFVFLFLIVFFASQYKKYPFYNKKGNFQTKIAKKIADSILSKNPKTPYQIVPIPLAETDNAYRYFLEIGGKRPLDEYDLNPGKELYVLCFIKLCNIENNPDLRIKNFKNKKIDSTWQVDRVKIYKIVHGK